jgi:hypothetical protein
MNSQPDPRNVKNTFIANKLASVDPNFANLTDMTPLNPPFEGGKFSPPPREGELEGVNLDLLSLF